MIVAETGEKTSEDDTSKCVFSIGDFGRFVGFLRRYGELKETQTTPSPSTEEKEEEEEEAQSSSTEIKDECLICMGSVERIVLPCLHAMCENCLKKWVLEYKDCPFCRTSYNDTKNRERNQWMIEDWSRKHMQGDAWDLECRIQEHWHQKRIFQEVDPDLWIRLRIPSVSTSPQDEEDDGFVRI
mmetsp:Transcript_33617/g.77569  ORF Transcript_33617/g.77569 Transcript_33617/m.77569 type:complete len:184 (+) Transcript_33617:570-1121(+)